MLIWFRPALLWAAILLCCWGGQGGKASTASAEGGLARWELRGGVLLYITCWPNPWQNKVSSMSLFIGSTILFIGNTILFIGSMILFIGSTILLIGSMILFIGSLFLFISSLFLFIGSLFLFIGSLFC